jgi:hypothetical protein
MKKITYLILFLFFSYSYSQNITFSDDLLRIRVAESTTSNNIAKDINGNSIKVDINDNGIITVAEATPVYTLDVSNNNPTDISSIAGLEFFPNLRNLDCSSNNITFINLTGFSILQILDCSSNNLGANGLVLTGCTGLTSLDVNSNNLLSAIDFSTLTNLQTVDASSCSLTTVDVSNCINLNSINCANNSLLTFFAKNGRNETITLSGGSNNGLTYVCVDESQIAAVQASLSSNPTCQVNSFCTDTPGGDYSRLSGYLVFDALSNGVDSSDPKFAYLKMKTIIGSDVYQTVTNNNGDFEFFTTLTSGSFLQTSVLENTSLCLPMSSLNASLTGADVINNQAILPVSLPLPDLEVVIAPKTQALPSTNATYKVVYKNKGTKITNGRLVLNYNNTLLSFVGSSNGAVTNAINQLSLDAWNLNPYETREFEVTFSVSATAAVGSQLNFNLSFNEVFVNTELLTDLADNVFVYNQVIETKPAVYIECLEGNSVDTSQIGKYLHYVINFNNNTNQTINDINIVNVFDASKFDMNSIQILYSYHPLKMQAKNNNVRYTLTNADVGGPGGSGGILLKIKTNDNLTTNSTVLNNADVYFDYGNPLTTNNEETVFQNLGVNQNNIDSEVSIYPNPTNSVLNIKSSNEIKYFEIYDVSGRLIQSSLVNSLDSIINISERSNGIYYLKVVTSEGIKVEKIIKK